MVNSEMFGSYLNVNNNKDARNQLVNRVYEKI